MRRTVTFASLAIAVLAFTACQASPEAVAPPPEAAEEAAPAQEPAAEVPSFLQFEAETLAGGTLNGADLAGKDVAMWFWAPWCPTCNAEAPGAAKVVNGYDGDVTIIGMAGRDSTGPMHEFVERYGFEGIEHTVSEDGALWTQFGVAGQPAWLFINDDGQADLYPGPLTERELQRRLGALEAA